MMFRNHRKGSVADSAGSTCLKAPLTLVLRGPSRKMGVAVAFCFHGLLVESSKGGSSHASCCIYAQTIAVMMRSLSYGSCSVSCLRGISEQGVGLEDLHLRGLSMCPDATS